MDLIKAIILGIVQGLSEFIPISSTAHLTLAGYILGIDVKDNPELWTAQIAVIQLGTLVAVFAYFWRDLLGIIKGIAADVKEKNFSLATINNHTKLGLLIVLGTIPIVTIGLALKKVIEGTLTKDLTVISVGLILVAILLFIAEKVGKRNRGIESIGFKDALIIGLSQCLALVPGASRSGSTIMSSLFLGIDREAAARFSFLLSIPAILGSGLLELKHALKVLPQGELQNLLIATVVSGIVGYVSIAFLLKYLRKNNTNLFIYYRIALGIIILSYFR